MIKLEELRHGSYYYVGGTEMVVTFNITQVEEQIKNAKGNRINFDGIPISKEWLRKFDYEFRETLTVFGRTYNNPHYSNDERWYIFKDNDNEYRFKYLEEDGYFHGPSLYFKFIHQLQALYFNLTGEELTLKK